MIIGISIPASVFATFCVMKVLDMSLNIITLGAHAGGGNAGR